MGSDNRELGIGLRVQGASDWRFDGDAGLSAQQAVDELKLKYGDEFMQTGCVRLRHNQDDMWPALIAMPSSTGSAKVSSTTT